MNPQKLDLWTPQSHYDRLHHSPHGTVIAWERLAPGKRWTKIHPHHPTAALLGPYRGKQDVFVTVNEFRHWRLIRNLKSLRACYVDIDGYTYWEGALDALSDAHLPSPSFIIFSGRGMHLYWLLEPLPAKALPVWQLVQDTLVSALAPLGADYHAKDCTRLLRLAGTVNSRTSEEVTGLWLGGDVWDLHQLTNEVLGYRPPKPVSILDFKAQATRRRRKIQTPGKGSIYAWWHLVHNDLVAIHDHHWLGGVPEGKRDTFLFLMANALSWYACPQSLETEIIHTAKTFTPSLAQREVQTYVKPILQRAKAAAEGKKYHWQGREVDPRYAFRTETIRQWLGEDLIPPELWPGLRALAPREVIRERKRERDKTREKTGRTRDRVAEGRYKQKREGFLSEAADRREEALRLREEGLSWKEVAERMRISSNAAKLLGSRAKK